MQVGAIISLAELAGPGVPQSYAEIRDQVRYAEAAGLDTVWFADHLLGLDPDDVTGSPWEAWSVLCALAEATTTIRLGTLVLCTAFRPPSVLARMADTLQEVSDGRLVLGLGAGWHRPEFRAFGVPFDYRAGRFADSLRIICGMLRYGHDTYAGPFHSIHEAPVRERPGRPVPRILVAGRRPRMLRLTAELADAWNLAWYGRPEQDFLDTNAELSRICESIGRDPSTLARSVGVRIAYPGKDAIPDLRRTPLPGDAPAIADALAAWQAEGMSEVICWVDGTDRAGIDLVAEAVGCFKAAHPVVPR
jgi:alkanesulfonate monooxygenase SsuD/methylene tetrahydromethanopterin reductase-like flavin-dependent oxidoreductase (luciferase family)